MRPEALIAGSNPVICATCKRISQKKTTADNHHLAGEANNPTIIPIPVNDHRAQLNVAQYDWPKQTRENPDGSPLIAQAACIRGFSDTIVYLIEKLLLPGADLLETLDAHLVKRLGPAWWGETGLEKFAPKHKS